MAVTVVAVVAVTVTAVVVVAIAAAILARSRIRLLRCLRLWFDIVLLKVAKGLRRWQHCLLTLASPPLQASQHLLVRPVVLLVRRLDRRQRCISIAALVA